MSSGSRKLPIAIDHPAFPGHFPDTPIVPGVVLLDEALAAIGACVGQDLSACHINSVKFLHPVGPGEVVTVEYVVQDSGAIKFDLISDTHKIAVGTVRALSTEKGHGQFNPTRC